MQLTLACSPLSHHYHLAIATCMRMLYLGQSQFLDHNCACNISTTREKLGLPTSVGNVRSFQGLASFYRRFVKDFSSLAAPLTKVIKKNVGFRCGEEQEKADFVKQIHEKARLNIERRTEQYATQANKGRCNLVFEPGDWIWLHMRKERFPAKRRSKLLPRGDGCNPPNLSLKIRKQKPPVST
jgi:hypothetical protein